MASKFRKPLSARVVATLKAKAKKSKLFNITDLKRSYKKGQGAFLSSGSRPKIPMAAWAMARVNKLIKLGARASFDKEIIRTAQKRKRKKK
tara:strand:- start:385 stop:657 length:273 start_codon:yes stop_codon:yes gene_type:complete